MNTIERSERNESDNENDHSIFSTSRDKCDFGDIMRYTLATCRWRWVHRYAKLGKYGEFVSIHWFEYGFLDLSSMVSSFSHN